MTEPTKPMNPDVEHLLSFFEFEHLPEHLHELSQEIHNLAHLAREFSDGIEMVAGLRKLLEAKDCFVRAQIADKADHE